MFIQPGWTQRLAKQNLIIRQRRAGRDEKARGPSALMPSVMWGVWRRVGEGGGGGGSLFACGPLDVPTTLNSIRLFSFLFAKQATFYISADGFRLTWTERPFVLVSLDASIRMMKHHKTSCCRWKRSRLVLKRLIDGTVCYKSGFGFAV